MRVKFRTRDFVLGTIAVASFGSVYPADAATELESANKLYLKGQVDGALILVDSYLKGSPKDSEAHYLKGHCLTKLKRLAEANHEYSLVVHLSPGTPAAQYAQTAMKQIELAQKKEAGSQASKHKHIPPGTLELIRVQESDASVRAIKVGSDEAEGEIKTSANQIRTDQERLERTIQLRGMRQDQYGLSPQQIESLRIQTAMDAERTKQSGLAKAAWREQEAKEKADGLKVQAEQLQERLVEDGPESKKTIKLNPVGTNLYIRNYLYNPPKALRAEAQKLPGSDSADLSSSAQGNSSSLRLKSKSQTATGSGSGTIIKRETKVKGNLIPTR